MPERVSAWAIYDVFETVDGEKIFVGVVSDKQWTQFCNAFGLDDLLEDAELQTNAQRGGAPRCVHAAPARNIRRARPVASHYDLRTRRPAFRADITTGPAFRRPSCKPHWCDGRSNPEQRCSDAGSDTPLRLNTAASGPASIATYRRSASTTKLLRASWGIRMRRWSVCVPRSAALRPPKRKECAEGLRDWKCHAWPRGWSG